MLRYIVLATVPFLWGTYAPLLKFIYTTEENPPPPMYFNLMSYLASFCTMQLVEWSDFTVAPTLPINLLEKSASIHLWRGGFELGVWLLAGSMLYIYGIQYTTATNAAILVQLSTVIVPVMESVLKACLPTWRTCVGCALAMVGVAMVISHTESDTPHIVADTAIGDVLVIAASMFYSLHIVRLGSIAKYFPPIRLAKVKSLTQLSVAGLVLLVLLNTSTETQKELTLYFSETGRSGYFPNMFILFCAFWNGAVCIGYTMWAQTFAQRMVSPTHASIVYSTQPVWAVIFSSILIHESLSFLNWTGIFIQLLACVIVAIDISPTIS